MSTRPAKKSNYVTVGSMLQGKENDEQGRPTYYIKFDNQTQITINGVDYTGKTIYVNRPTDKFDRMLAKGAIEQAEYDQKVSEYLDDNGKKKFVKFDLTTKLN